MTQAELAAAIGVNAGTVSRWERGERTPMGREYRRAMQVLRDDAPDGLGTDVPRGTSDPEDAWAPNPALKGIIPQRAYDTAIDYCRRLVRAGLPTVEIERLERVMIDTRYAKVNSRRGRELSEEDWIILVDDVWDAIRETLGTQGIQV